MRGINHPGFRKASLLPVIGRRDVLGEPQDTTEPKRSTLRLKVSKGIMGSQGSSRGRWPSVTCFPWVCSSRWQVCIGPRTSWNLSWSSTGGVNESWKSMLLYGSCELMAAWFEGDSWILYYGFICQTCHPREANNLTTVLILCAATCFDEAKRTQACREADWRGLATPRTTARSEGSILVT